MIKYLGSKRRLLPHLVSVVDGLSGVERVLDLFSGTARVGHALKRAGYQVVSNDHNRYAATLARCYVAADATVWREPSRRLLEELQAAPPKDGWFTEAYCRQARFFTPENGARIEGMRERIAALDLEPPLEAIVLTSLLEAADRVDSTTGVQMAYLKQWAPRALGDIALRMPKILPGRGAALELDALEAARRTSVDLAYLDPPYNQHNYRANYHVWETLVRWDQPDTYGVVQKRMDCRTEKSAFNSRPRIAPAMRELIDAVDARYLLMSFNDEGYLAPEQLTEMLATRGETGVFAIEQPRYVGARIGIHNHKGKRVGRVGRLQNVEYFFLSAPDEATLTRVAAALDGDLTRVALEDLVAT